MSCHCVVGRHDEMSEGQVVLELWRALCAGQTGVLDCRWNTGGHGSVITQLLGQGECMAWCRLHVHPPGDWESIDPWWLLIPIGYINHVGRFWSNLPTFNLMLSISEKENTRYLCMKVAPYNMASNLILSCNFGTALIQRGKYVVTDGQSDPVSCGICVWCTLLICGNVSK